MGHQNRNQITLCGDNTDIHHNCFGDLVLEVLMPLLKAIIGNGLFDQPDTVDSDVANLFLNCKNKVLNLGYLVNLVTQDVMILVSVNLSKKILAWGKLVAEYSLSQFM